MAIVLDKSSNAIFTNDIKNSSNYSIISGNSLYKIALAIKYINGYDKNTLIKTEEFASYIKNLDYEKYYKEQAPSGNVVVFMFGEDEYDDTTAGFQISSIDSGSIFYFPQKSSDDTSNYQFCVPINNSSKKWYTSLTSENGCYLPVSQYIFWFSKDWKESEDKETSNIAYSLETDTYTYINDNESINSYYAINNQTLTDIASSIRQVRGENELYYPSQMGEKILSRKRDNTDTEYYTLTFNFDYVYSNYPKLEMKVEAGKSIEFLDNSFYSFYWFEKYYSTNLNGTEITINSDMDFILATESQAKLQARTVTEFDLAHTADDTDTVVHDNKDTNISTWFLN